MKCAPISLSRLLLGGLCMFVLSACAQTIQPWVQPEVSQKMKRLQIENYLLKHDLANYRKKLMQANIGKRKLAKKLQMMRNAKIEQPQNSMRKPAPQQQQSAMQKTPQTPAAAKQKSRTVKPAISTQAAAKANNMSMPRDSLSGKSAGGKPIASKQHSSKPAAATAALKNDSQAIKPEDWKLKKRLFFGSGHKGMSPAMRRQIDAFVKTLSPEAKIRIAGHSDGEPVGGFAGKTHQSSHALADNKAVSLERGMAVVRALIAAGIDSKRIQVAGFGATKPLAPNDTAEGRAKNRRVEIFVAEPETTAKSTSAPAIDSIQRPASRVNSQPASAQVVAVKAIASEILSETPAKTTPTQAAPAQQATMQMRLFFDMGQKWTSPEMRRQLRAFAKSLPPTAKIRIVGHADGLPVHQPTASLADNQAMSLARAKSVFRGLKAYGISAERMQVEAFGASRPLASNDTAEGRAKNRRVEIFIIQ